MPESSELVDARSPTAVLAAASGLAWGLVASLVGSGVFDRGVWGGILLAPLIGILIGRLSWPLHDKARSVQIAGSLFFLYLAATLFAIGVGAGSFVIGPAHARLPATLLQHVLGVLWGLTFGYVFLFWPLSFFNHRLLWRAGEGQRPAPPEIRTTSAAVRQLATRIMALAVLGYVVWALLQYLLRAWVSSTSMMPWWVVTGVMVWSTWLVLGILVWLLAPVLASGATLAAGSETRATATYGEMIGVLGFAVFAFPLFYVAATLIVAAIKMSLVQSWATEGTFFWAPGYYRNVLRTYFPFFVVGAGMIGVRLLVGRRW